MQRDWFLYLTTFVCGTAVMGIEIAAARYLAPYFGSSMVTWTILIGVIMTSLSIGNIIGGMIADTPPARDKMYRLIGISAMWIALTPFIGKYIVSISFLVLMMAFPGSVLEAGMLFSACSIFAVPCIVLGTVTPCLIRLGIRDLEHSGRLAGELYALSTVGSILGTLLPTFLTIPLIGTSRTFLLFGGLLGTLSLCYFLGRPGGGKVQGVSVALMTILLLMPYSGSYAFWKDTVFEGESMYNYLQVSQSGGETVLSTHVEIGRQSILKPGEALTGTYYDYALAAPFFRRGFNREDPFRILVIGFGAGTYARLCRLHFPSSSIDGVEIDPGIVDLGYRFFGLASAQANVFTEDGRAFLTRFPDRKYDLVFLDAFQDVTIPFHLATTEFFRLVKDHINPGGILAVNINLHFKGNERIVNSVCATARTVFPGVWACPVSGITNAVVFASSDPGAVGALAANPARHDSRYTLQPVLKKIDSGLKETDGDGMVFTDDLSGIELVTHEIVTQFVELNLRSMISCIAIGLSRKEK